MMPGKITRIAKRIQLKTIRVILSSPKKGSTDQRADLTGLNRLNVVTYKEIKTDISYGGSGIMAKQQPEGVYLYIDDSGSRFIAVVDAFGVANMLPWKQPGEFSSIQEKSWNLQGEFIRLKISD